MNRVIEDGKAFYWGTSEWSASQIMEAFVTCEKLNLIKPIVEQPQYNMFVRDKFEKEYEMLFKKYNLGTTTWSPLMSGILSGKYVEGIPTGSRFDVFSSESKMHYNSYQTNKTAFDEKIIKLKAIADKLGFSLASLAIAWVIKNPDVSTCLLGVSKLEQLEDNLKALDILPLLTKELEEEIEKILGNTPAPDFNWRDFKPNPKGRRCEAICSKF